MHTLRCPTPRPPPRPPPHSPPCPSPHSTAPTSPPPPPPVITKEPSTTSTVGSDGYPRDGRSDTSRCVPNFIYNLLIKSVKKKLRKRFIFVYVARHFLERQVVWLHIHILLLTSRTLLAFALGPRTLESERVSRFTGFGSDPAITSSPRSSKGTADASSGVGEEGGAAGNDGEDDERGLGLTAMHAKPLQVIPTHRSHAEDARLHPATSGLLRAPSSPHHPRHHPRHQSLCSPSPSLPSQHLTTHYSVSLRTLLHRAEHLLLRGPCPSAIRGQATTESTPTTSALDWTRRWASLLDAYPHTLTRPHPMLLVRVKPTILSEVKPLQSNFALD